MQKAVAFLQIKLGQLKAHLGIVDQIIFERLTILFQYCIGKGFHCRNIGLFHC